MQAGPARPNNRGVVGVPMTNLVAKFRGSTITLGDLGNLPY